MSVSNNTGATYNGFGAMFVTPGKTSYRLYDISLAAASGTISASVWRNQTITFMQPGAMKTDLDKQFYYIPTDKKWYYKNPIKDTEGQTIIPAGTEAPDMEIPAGTGFLTTFGRAVKVNYSGEVLPGSGEPTIIKKPTDIATGVAATYFFAINPLPMTVKLHDISLSAVSGTISASVWRNQTITFMQSGAMKTDLDRQFYYIPTDKKWYYKNPIKDAEGQTIIPAGTEAPNMEIPAGTGFLCTFGRDVQIEFPAINY